MFFDSDDLHNCCRCCGRKQLDRQQKLVNTFYLLVSSSILYMQNSFWHKSRSFSVTGWMWHVSAVVSRFLPKSEQIGTMESLPNIRVEVSTLQSLQTLHSCKLIQECWYNSSKYCITSSETHFMLLFHDAVCWYYDYGVFGRHRIITWPCVTENAP